jgi:hypothetical protein
MMAAMAIAVSQRMAGHDDPGTITDSLQDLHLIVKNAVAPAPKVLARRLKHKIHRLGERALNTVPVAVRLLGQGEMPLLVVQEPLAAPPFDDQIRRLHEVHEPGIRF